VKKIIKLEAYGGFGIFFDVSGIIRVLRRKLDEKILCLC
jgi:hypothetical protein